jgi:hypothetical protein
MIEHSVHWASLPTELFEKALRIMRAAHGAPGVVDEAARRGDLDYVFLYCLHTVSAAAGYEAPPPGRKGRRKGPSSSYATYATDWLILRARGIAKEKAYAMVAQRKYFGAPPPITTFGYFGAPPTTTKTVRKAVKMMGWENK